MVVLGVVALGKKVLVSYYVHYFYQPLGAVEFGFLFGSEFDFAGYNCINSIVASNTDAFAGNEFCSSLTDYNTARFSQFSRIKLHA